MTKNVIAIGMIGIPETDDDPVLRALQSQQRMQLSAAYSPLYANAETFSRENQSSPFGSLRQIVNHDCVQGLIWNEQFAKIDLVNWGIGPEPKPVLVRRQFLEQCSLESLVRLRDRAATDHVVVLPELLHRWTPATLRLRELIATQLGPIREMTVNVQHSDKDASLVRSIDWIRMLLAFREVSVATNREIESVYLEFVRRDGPPPICYLNITNGKSDSFCNHGEASPSRIDCESGTVEIISDESLRWRTGEDWVVEHLESDRSAADVMLDLFGRRIVGGIVPVPDLNEYLRSYRLIAAIRQSQESGDSINVDDALIPIDHGEFNF